MLKFFRGERLLSRIFLHGLAVLLASAFTFVVLGVVMIRPGLDRDAVRFGKWMAPQLCGQVAIGAQEAEGVAGFAAAVYTDDGRLRSMFAKSPLPPLSSEQVARLRRDGIVEVDGGPVRGFACPEEAGGGYILFGPPPSPEFVGRLAIPVIVVIVIMGLASLPLARSIARPIEDVVAVTRAFGRGDLSARAETKRGDEVGDLARAFNDMAQRLEQLIRAEKELLANVSHELRTPLARIRVVLETGREDPKRAQSLLVEIGTDLEDLERLVENVMDSMRLDLGGLALTGGQLAVYLQPTDIGGALLEAVDRFRETHPKRWIEVDGTPELVEAEADATLLRRLFDNLLENANKYSDESSPILARMRGGSEMVHVEIVDKGIGIDPEDVPRVFDPFFRSDRSRSRATGGTGLGLALAKRIVDVHRGIIGIQSAPGLGTTVTVALKRL